MKSLVSRTGCVGQVAHLGELHHEVDVLLVGPGLVEARDEVAGKLLEEGDLSEDLQQGSHKVGSEATTIMCCVPTSDSELRAFDFSSTDALIFP